MNFHGLGAGTSPARAGESTPDLHPPMALQNMVGDSEAIQRVAERIRRFANGFHSILITGQTGTGKELVARALHRLSPVSDAPLVVCNCGAIVPTLFESELFGHVRGAFTGASRDKVGLAELAAGGILFLDEIGEIPTSVQAKLLRLMQEREIQRVGSSVTRKVEVRIIAATNRDLHAMVERGEFREDLYYRLGATIHVPPLYERKEDIPALVQHFLSRARSELGRPGVAISAQAMERLMNYNWPGNVRELENAVHSAVMLAQGAEIGLRHLPELVQGFNTREEADSDELITLEECKRRHAARVLKRMGGNSSRAAQVLDISRATLYRLLAERGADESPRAADPRAAKKSLPR